MTPCVGVLLCVERSPEKDIIYVHTNHHSDAEVVILCLVLIGKIGLCF
jgi:hypothetical protein